VDYTYPSQKRNGRKSCTQTWQAQQAFSTTWENTSQFGPTMPKGNPGVSIMHIICLDCSYWQRLKDSATTQFSSAITLHSVPLLHTPSAQKRPPSEPQEVTLHLGVYLIIATLITFVQNVSFGNGAIVGS
jgi:hypothetical protein